jgi:general stress protein YciG
MTNPKTDTRGFSSENSDAQRDMGAKGGPTTGLGRPDGKHGISRPYDEDLQTQITAKGGKKSKKALSKKSNK